MHPYSQVDETTNPLSYVGTYSYISFSCTCKRGRRDYFLINPSAYEALHDATAPDFIPYRSPNHVLIKINFLCPLKFFILVLISRPPTL
jgi:hypothetical protein